MKKRWLCALLAVLMLFGLAACGASRGGGSMSNSASSSDAAPAEATDGDFGWTEDTAEDSGADFSAVRANAKLILYADLTMETTDFEQSCADLERMTAETGGYIESSGVSGRKGERSANYTLRVPQEKYEAFYTQLGDNCHVTSSNRWSEDVTEQYTDVETRLATLKTKHERLLALLGQATKMEDIISIENALSDCEYEMDSLTGEKRHYDDLVGFSTFTIWLREVQTLSAVADGTGLGAEIAQAARTGLVGVTEGARAALLTVVALWPVVIAAVIVAVVVLRLRRRRKAEEEENGEPIEKT